MRPDFITQASGYLEVPLMETGLQRKSRVAGGKEEGVKASILDTLSVAGRRMANQRWSRPNPGHRRLGHLVPRMAKGTLQMY